MTSPMSESRKPTLRKCPTCGRGGFRHPRIEPRPPRDSDGTEMKVGDSLLGHGFVTNITYPMGTCLSCGRIVNIDTGEGHDEARHVA